MSCSGETIHRLQTCDANSSEYATLVAHIDKCAACQAQADAEFSQQLTDWEWHDQLSTLAEPDLEVPDYQSSLTIDVSDDESEAPMELASDDPPDMDFDFLNPAPHPELLGRLGRYDIEQVIGRGGMGVVFRAFDRDLHRVVALKVLASHLSSSAAARRRFSREARAAAAVHHPNVLPIHNVEADAQTPYLVMQYVSGCSLQTRVQREGPLPVADVLRIARQTALALAAAHEQGLIHRDVKPANILLEEETDRIVLGDFGLARTADEASLTRTGIIAGTPHYMSPEQACGDPISASSDLFSLGNVMYFMLSGRPAFRGETAMGVLHCVCEKKPEPLNSVNNEVPWELAQVVHRLLAKKPSQRVPSARALAKQLESLLADYQQGKLRIGRRPLNQFTALVAGSIVCGLLVGLWCWSQWRAAVEAQTARQRAAAVRPLNSDIATSNTVTGNGGSEARPRRLPAISWQDWDASHQTLQAQLSTLEAQNSTSGMAWQAMQREITPDPWQVEFNLLRQQIDIFGRELDQLSNWPSVELPQREGLAPETPSPEIRSAE